MITSGVAQGLSLITRCCANGASRGSAWRTPAPGRSGAQLTAAGMEPVAIPVDDEGLDVDALERSGVRVVLVTPAHQFPTGRRAQPGAARTAARMGRAGPRGRLRRQRRSTRSPVTPEYPLRPRAGRRAPRPGAGPRRVPRHGQQDARPGAADGLARGAAGLAEAILLEKANDDKGTPVFEQLALAAAARARRDRPPHPALPARLPRRRDALLAALAQHLPEATPTGVAAGLHVVLDLPARIDDRRWRRRPAGAAWRSCRSRSTASRPVARR